MRIELINLFINLNIKHLYPRIKPRTSVYLAANTYINIDSYNIPVYALMHNCKCLDNGVTDIFDSRRMNINMYDLLIFANIVRVCWLKIHFTYKR